MPPKTELTREKILNAAFELVREEGLEVMTTRRIAQRLHCSTQPIYSACGNMEQIREAVLARAGECARDYMTGYRDDRYSAALNLAIGFMQFAQMERHFFRALYLSGYLQYDPNTDLMLGEKLLGDSVDAGYFRQGSRIHSLTVEQRRQMYKKLSIYLIGIGTMLNTNAMKLETQEAADMVAEMYEMLLAKEGVGR
jgi:AcrR family transcriptional regulator